MVSIFGHHTPLQLTDLPVGRAVHPRDGRGRRLRHRARRLVVQSTYPLLGALRSAAQVISYEVAMGLRSLQCSSTPGSLSTSEIVRRSTTCGTALPLLPSFLMYIVSMVGETNRAPFDLPEAESELVAGFHTEYSSIKFAMFFLAEYVNMATVSRAGDDAVPRRVARPVAAVAHRQRCAQHRLVAGAVVPRQGLRAAVLYIWLRGTLPRLRYDQFMSWAGRC